MELLHKYLVQDRDFSSYEDFIDNFKINLPDTFNFAFDVVDFYAQNAPEKRALVWCDDDDNEKIFTFKQISDLSSQAANFLIKMGIKKGDAVMLVMHRRYEYWFFVLALHKIGAIGVPVTDQLLKNDFEYRIKAVNAKMLVAGTNAYTMEQISEAVKADKNPKKLVSVTLQKDGWIDYHQEINNFSFDFARPSSDSEFATKNDDPMLIYFTSGTSGNPKMVVHNFVYPLGHIITAKYWQNVVSDGLHYSMAETGWAKASWGKLYGQWLAGSAVFVYDRRGFNPEKILSKLEKYKITTFCAPPTIYRYLVKQDFSKYDLSSLKCCTTAGEALNGEVFTKFYEKTGLQIHEGYGQTEASVMIANLPFFDAKQGSMGKICPGYDIKIVDVFGRECKPKQEGEIVINLSKNRPFGLFAGYYHDKRMTLSVFKGGFYHTGDMAYKDEDGYVWFVSRKDDIIKSSGFRISPFEVESVLLKHKAVLECAVSGEDDFFRGKSVKASIVLSSGFTPSKNLENEIIDFAKHQTALYKCPRKIEFVKELPKTYNGKIKRKSRFRFFFLFSLLSLISFSCSLKYDEIADAESSNPEFVFSGAHLYRYENAKETASIQAESLERYKDDSTIYGKNVEFKTYNNKHEIETEGSCGYLVADSDAELYELYDGIKLFSKIQNTNFYADMLRWNGKTEQLAGGRRDTAKIEKDGTVIYGSGFSASGVSKQFNFSGTVSGEIETKDNSEVEE